MKNKYKITSISENECEVNFEFDDKELNLVKMVLSKLNIAGDEQGYCPSFDLKTESGEYIIDSDEITYNNIKEDKYD